MYALSESGDPHQYNDPTYARRLLGSQLSELRGKTGLSASRVASRINASQSKISRIESGRLPVTEHDLKSLIDLYGVTDPDERRRLIDLARQTIGAAWWQEYGDLVPSWEEMLLSMERVAQVIRTYNPGILPDLLQTRGYAEAIWRYRTRSRPCQEMWRRLDLHMARQTILRRPEQPCRLWAIIPEGVLYRKIGGAQIMHDQIRHLIKMCELPNVTIQILPLGAVGHPDATGPITLLRFAPKEMPDVVYLPKPDGADYVDGQKHTGRHLVILDAVSVAARPCEQSPAILRSFLKIHDPEGPSGRHSLEDGAGRG